MASSRLLALLALFPLANGFVFGGQGQGSSEPGVKCEKVQGILLTRTKDQPWRAVRPEDAVDNGALLIALFEAQLRSKNEAVEVSLMGDVGTHKGLPVLETAVRVRHDPKVDMDLTLERGIVVLTNIKKKGAAKVRVRLRDDGIDVTLAKPGTSLGIEMFGRHAPGLARIKADDPTTFLFFLTLKGEAVLHHGDKSVALKAPPGPALLRWDSIFREPTVDYLEKLPEEFQ